MSDFVIITASDIHISDIKPRARLDDFKETILNKLNQMKVVCNKLNADAAIIAGDLFNTKNPTKNTHGLNRELIELFQQFKCPVYMIPGNHDLTGNALESIGTQPLGVLFASGALKNLTQEIIRKKGQSVSLVGIPYIDDLDLSKINLPAREQGCVAQICVMHVYAGPQPGNVFKERLYGYDELSALDADIFVLGHYHIDQGIQTSGNKYFINLGSIARGSLTDENVNHQPKLGYIRIGADKTITAQEIPLKIKPAEDVFDLKKREEEKKEIDEMQKFVDHLIIGSTVSGTDRDYNALIDQMDLAKTVKDKVLHFIHEATAL